jgi:hypothetical protein
MRVRHLKTIFLAGTVALIFAFFGCSSVPESYKSASEYMNGIYKRVTRIQEDMWSYIRSFAHVKDNAQVEANRQKVITTIKNAITDVNKIEPYNDDFLFKNGVLDYLNIQSAVINEDYAKIINMEEVSEQSYDAMEAYLLAQKKANLKMEDAIKALEEKEQIFAKNNQVTITKTSNATSEKLKKASEVMDYDHSVYLIFFKSYKQEWYMVDALSKEDMNKTEQNKQTLVKYSDEGLKNLSPIQPYENDDSIKNVCKNALEYYKKEVSESMPVFLDYLVKKEDFEKIKKALDLKKDSEKTQKDVDYYNGKVNELNEMVKKYDETMKKMNDDRKKIVDSWNEAENKFIDVHVPK